MNAQLPDIATATPHTPAARRSCALFVPGSPAPKGSRTSGTRRDGTAFTRPAAKGEPAWVEAVARLAMAHRKNAPAPPYVVTLGFQMPQPSRPAHDWPSRGDIDKLARAVLDGLVRGGLLTDDAHVVEVRAFKTWAPSARDVGVRVVVATADVGSGLQLEEACR